MKAKPVIGTVAITLLLLASCVTMTAQAGSKVKPPSAVEQSQLPWYRSVLEYFDLFSY
ncbi:hypothetical protein [Aliiglaciecola sp. LCG003]|uniref:hypothetical protein n=1 Tax=Aliiglaciecola sp. LCG003 TaxID=3053655 RepID=UPI0025731E23|nr:hypothetical protein [Aliiglaciecola sp. LCG003]WJG08334.1 hypothetical protein QR722_13415 [Aliiglaciecola sp. LCG003]